jgi:hypothetical protein
MRGMNAEVVFNKRLPAAVARAFLRRHGLV